MEKIDRFDKEYFFLSNFYSAKVNYKGITFRNNEAAFQSMKACDMEERYKFRDLKPSEAKKLGRTLSLPPNWEANKEYYMREICYAKFTQNKYLRKKLLDTYPAFLEEGNWWGDREWGTVNGVGNNKLGYILMDIREILRKERNNKK